MTATPNDNSDAFLSPGDQFIDSTNVTLFDVMDYQAVTSIPWQIIEALGLTHDQFILARDYIDAHRSELEPAYRAARTASAQRMLHALTGVYRPTWEDRAMSLAGFALGTAILAFGLSRIGYESMILIGLLIGGGSLFMCLGVYRLYTSWYESCTFTQDQVIDRRAGARPDWSANYDTIRDLRFSGMALTFTCTDSSTYQMICPISLRRAVRYWLDGEPITDKNHLAK